MTRNELEMKKRIEQHELELNAVAQHINLFKRHFDELFKKADIPAEFHDLKDKLEDHVKRFESFESSSKSHFASFLVNVADVKQNIISHLKVHEPFEGRFGALEKAVDEIKQEFSKKHASLHAEVMKQLSQIADSHRQSVQKLEQKFTDSPKSLSDTYKEMMKKFDQVSLDCSNAIKRCRNTDGLQQKLEAKLKEFEGKAK